MDGRRPSLDYGANTPEGEWEQQFLLTLQARGFHQTLAAYQAEREQRRSPIKDLFGSSSKPPPEPPPPPQPPPLPPNLDGAFHTAEAVPLSDLPAIREQSAADDSVVFFQEQEVLESDEDVQARLCQMSMRVVYDPTHNGLEESVNFPIAADTLVADRYQIVDYLGAGVFSRAVQCIERQSGKTVCIKIVRNNKDFLDQSLGEIKLLRYLNENDPNDSYHIVRMYDFFYFREHLFIVCELLRDNLYELYKYVAKSGWPPYFTLARVRSIGRQMMTALSYIHSLDLLHCDVKPENILIKSLSRCVVKLIDFGSSSFIRDPHSSYVQSRSYRAPEVVCGLPYGQKIDVWSLGCILAEVYTGKPLFDNRTAQTLIASQIAYGGMLPRRYMASGKHAHKYFYNERIFMSTENENGEEVYAYLRPKPVVMAERLGCGGGTGATANQEEAVFVDFMSRLLSVDDDLRLSASAALDHRFLTEVQAPPPKYRADLQPPQEEVVIEAPVASAPSPSAAAAAAAAIEQQQQPIGPFNEANPLDLSVGTVATTTTSTPPPPTLPSDKLSPSYSVSPPSEPRGLETGTASPRKTSERESGESAAAPAAVFSLKLEDVAESGPNNITPLTFRQRLREDRDKESQKLPDEGEDVGGSRIQHRRSSKGYRLPGGSQGSSCTGSRTSSRMGSRPESRNSLVPLGDEEGSFAASRSADNSYNPSLHAGGMAEGVVAGLAALMSMAPSASEEAATAEDLEQKLERPPAPLLHGRTRPNTGS